MSDSASVLAERWGFMRRLDQVITDEQWSDLRNLLAMEAHHFRVMVPTYGWASNCPHDTDALEDFGSAYVGELVGTDRSDVDEHHQRDEDGELFCLLSPLGEECVCGDGCCGYASSVRAQQEDFWDAVGRGRS